MVGSAPRDYFLFLDDERYPGDVFWMELPQPPLWEIVRTQEAFFETITRLGLPAHISFDHDLGEDADGRVIATGMDCAKWLVEYCLDHAAPVPDFTVHSKNPAGAANIRGLLEGLRRAQGPSPRAPGR